MLNPFVNLLSSLISLLNIGLFVWIVIGLLMQFDIINRHSPLVQRVYFTLGRLFDPLLLPIRRVLGRILPDLGGIDLSPILLILAFRFIDDLLYSWFYSF